MIYDIAVWGTGSTVIVEDNDTLHCRASKLIHNISERYLADGKILSKENSLLSAPFEK